MVEEQKIQRQRYDKDDNESIKLSQMSILIIPLPLFLLLFKLLAKWQGPSLHSGGKN